MKKAASIMVLAVLAAALLTACSSDNGGGGVSGGAAGTGVISMKGGAGDTGGNVGTWQMQTYQVKGVRISSAGSADTSFSVPGYNPPFEGGDNLYTAASSTTVVVLKSGDADPGAGVPYLVTGDTNLYIGDGSDTVPGAAERATGLKVNAGATLTLGLNYNTGSSAAEDMAYVTFTNDVDIAGNLKTADLTTAITAGGPDGTVRDMGALDLETDTQMFVRSTGSINTKGTDAAAATNDNGGNGGYLYLYAGNYFANNGTIDNSGGNGDGTGNGGNAGVSTWGWNYLQVSVNGGNDPRRIGGVFINTGSMTANGGNGAAGGATSQVYLEANSNVFNTGPIASNAGTGSTGIGGDGNWGIYIYSYYASIYNSGAISQKGGDGATGGGNGGYVYLYAGAWNNGDLVNSGNITTTAGNCTGSGDGGGAQNIDMYAYGAIRTSGNLTMNGGNGHGAGSGGYGGYLNIANWAGYDYGRSASLPVGDIQVSGNISLNGGNGGATGAAGSGGDFYIYQNSSDNAASDTGIMLLGYASADLSGGNGIATGGNAGNMYIYTYNDYPAGWSAVPPGPITNEIAITGKGGSASGATGLGGSGLYMYWLTDGWEYGPGGVSILTNRGNIDASGGAGGTGGGGNSNMIDWYGHDGVVNSGNITMKGGDSAGGTGGDGADSGIWIYSSLDIVNSGTINTTGGSGDVGGNGSRWSGTPDPFGNWVALIAGGQARNTGSIICNGGAGATTNGNGGGIELYSEKEGSVFGSTSIAAGAGAGAAGTAGQVWVDGMQVK
jgi:hypothetical protein